MSRPETIEDVDQYQRQPHVFINIDPQFLTFDVNVGAAVLNLIAAARASDLFEVSEDGEFKVSVPLTDAELDGRLKSEQRSWDYNQKDYEKVCNGEYVEPWRRPTLDRWAENEGFESIDWVEYERNRAEREQS